MTTRRKGHIEFDLRSRKKTPRVYRLEQWSYERREWVLLATYAEIDWGALDRRASIGTDVELRLVDGSGIILAEWRNGARKGAAAE